MSKPKSKSNREKLFKEEILHIAHLANLTLSKQEVERFQKQLSETLNYFEVLKELNTEEVEPTSQITGLKNVVRKDKTKYSISQEEVLSGAKSKFNGHFKIKAVIEK